jgi:SNF2 family DNA or RNA helicase
MADKVASFKYIANMTGIVPEHKWNDWAKQNGLIEIEGARGKYKNHNVKKADAKEYRSLTETKDLVQISKFLFPKYGYRVRKNEIPDFPEVQNIALLVQTKNIDKQNLEFKKLMQKIMDLKAKKGKDMQAQILVLRLRYRQLAELNKIDTLVDLARNHRLNGHRVVIFVNFTETLLELSKKLKTNCLVYGDQKDEQRSENIRRFQGDLEPYIILNLQAGGVGISLHDLHGRWSRVALICPSDNARQLVQAMGRIHRAGAKSKAINYLLYAENTIEEKIYKNVLSKIDNINAFNDGDLAEQNVFEVLNQQSKGEP